MTAHPTLDVIGEADIVPSVAVRSAEVKEVDVADQPR